MPTHLENENTLVADARAGNGDAFAALLSQYDTRLFRLALRITGNQQDAADALQEALLKAFRGLVGFRGDSRFYTWIVRIVLNEGLIKLRERRRDLMVSLNEPIQTDDDSFMPREIEDWGDNPEQRYSKTEFDAILNQNLDQLEPTLRIVFLLRDVEGFSIEETARMLGLSIPAVKTRLLRARLKLRERLTKYFKQGARL
jgi:RNA polymerase sigma-70 factor (ECF subfamily)